jgi:hypothetical protein
MQGELWYALTAYTGNGATFFITISFIDAGSNVLASTSILSGTTTVGYTREPFASPIPAPIGTRNAQLTLQVSGSVISNTPLADVDDIQFGVV